MFMLSKEAKISSAIPPTAGAAGTTDIEGTILDMAASPGFLSVLVLVRMGAITSTGVQAIKMRQSDASDMTGSEDIVGSSQTIADSDDEKSYYIDVHRPTKRYVQLYVDRATANAVVSSAHYIQYNAAKAPTSHGSNVAGETFTGAIGGTA